MSWAVQYEGHHRLRVVSQPHQAPGVNQVEIAPAYTGLCGTDLHTLAGAFDDSLTLPTVLGHETAGRISALGSDVTGWSVGDPVAVIPYLACGACRICRTGTEYLCPELTFLGCGGPGALRQRWTIPVDRLVRLRPDVDLRRAALIEPVAVAVHATRRAGALNGQTVIVVGGGPVGLILGLVAARTATDVLIIEPDTGRRALAAGLGLSVLDPGTSEVDGFVREWSGGDGAAVAFEASGTQAGLTAAHAAVGVHGRVCQVGLHLSMRSLDLNSSYLRETTLLTARLYSRDDVEAAAELVQDDELPLNALLSHVLPLHRTAEAFSLLGARGQAMKVLIDCQHDIQT